MSKTKLTVFLLMSCNMSTYIRTPEEHIKMMSIHHPDALRGIQASKVYFPSAFRYEDARKAGKIDKDPYGSSYKCTNNRWRDYLL